MSMVLVPAIARRRDTWLKDLADGLEQLEKRVDSFKIKKLQNNEAFVSAVLDASRAAISTHKEDKREALRNAVLNIALGRGPHEDEAEMFLRCIEEFTPWHIRILACLDDSEAM